MGFWMDVLLLTAIDGIVVLGLYIIYLTGQWSISHAAFMGVGGYVSGYAVTAWGYSLLWGALIGIAAGAILAVVVGALGLRLVGFFQAILTISFGEAMVSFMNIFQPFGGALGYREIERYTTLQLVYVTLFLLALAVYLFDRSALACKVRAVKEDATAAASIGINVALYKVTAFGVGGAVAALGGVLYAHRVGIMQPADLGFMHSFILIVFLIIGGAESMWGALAGTFIFSLLPEFLRFAPNSRFIFYGIAVVFVMLLRPHGLIGRRPSKGWRPRISTAPSAENQRSQDAPPSR